MAKRIRTRSTRKRRPIISYVQPVETGYDDTIINSILSGRTRARATEYSLLFNSVLSTITPGLRNLYYKSGISIGKLVNKHYQKRKHYIWYEESVADLVSFLEMAGFNGITYNIFQDRIDIKFNNRDKTFLGTHIHVFEAGIISGFLSSAKEQYIKVEEIACSNNGSDFCHFVTRNTPVYFESKGKETLGRFVDGLVPHLEFAGSYADKFSDEYYALASSTLLESEYSDNVGKIAYHVGSEIGSKLNLRSSTKTLEKLYALLNLGDLKVKSLKPISIEMQFKRLKAKKEFVDISMAFIGGLLKEAMKGSEMATKYAKGKNSYMVTIKELKR